MLYKIDVRIIIDKIVFFSIFYPENLITYYNKKNKFQKNGYGFKKIFWKHLENYISDSELKKRNYIVKIFSTFSKKTWNHKWNLKYITHKNNEWKSKLN